MKLSFIFGNITSFVSMVMVLSSFTQPYWAYDRVNSVDIGLWYLSGSGVQYKLINAGVLSTDAMPAGHTSYTQFCSYSIVKDKDQWCRSYATFTRAVTVGAVATAVFGFVFSVMASLHIQTPTWNGEGRQTTLSTSVICAFVQCACLVLATVVWHVMVKEYDLTCRQAMTIEDFTCISTNKSHRIAIADAILSFVVYLYWRVVHSYDVAQHKGRIADGFTLAAKTDNVDEILSAIANKIDVDALGSDGRNALHWACTLHRTSICHILVKKGASLSKKDREGWTALHWASRVGSLDIVRLLAKGGADINVQDRWGTTPLMLTVVGENRMAAETLIELGASVDIRNVFGQTVLMQCLESGTHLHQLGMLFINAGANLTLTDAQGMTALHYAAANGNVSLFVNMLQLCDAELVEKKNKFNENAMDLADLRRHPNILALVDDWREGRALIVEHPEEYSVHSSSDDDSV